MTFIAIMEARPDNRIGVHAELPSEADADAHIAAHIGTYPDAFSVDSSVGDHRDFLVDMANKSVSVVPHPPPDFNAIDQATVDAMLLNSGVMRAFGFMMFEIGKAGKTDDWSFFDGVTNLATFKTLFKSLIR